MTFRLLLFTIFLFSAVKLQGQIELIEKSNISAYVLEDLAGPGVSITNISLKGFKNQIKAFEQSNTQLGFDSGYLFVRGMHTSVKHLVEMHLLAMSTPIKLRVQIL